MYLPKSLPDVPDLTNRIHISGSETTVYGYSGTASEAFAKERNFHFIDRESGETIPPVTFPCTETTEYATEWPNHGETTNTPGSTVPDTDPAEPAENATSGVSVTPPASTTTETVTPARSYPEIAEALTSGTATVEIRLAAVPMADVAEAVRAKCPADADAAWYRTAYKNQLLRLYQTRANHVVEAAELLGIIYIDNTGVIFVTLTSQAQLEKLAESADVADLHLTGCSLHECQAPVDVVCCGAIGDPDRNGQINASDAARILMLSAKFGAYGTCDPLEMACCDVDGSGGADASDAAIVLMFAAQVGTGDAMVRFSEFVGRGR